MGHRSSTTRLVTYSCPRRFLAHAEPFLMDHEVENNMLIGLAEGMSTGGGATGETALREPSQFTVVEENGQIVMASIRIPPHSLLVSLGPPNVARRIAGELASLGMYPGVRGHASTAMRVAEGIAKVSGQIVRTGLMQRLYDIYSIPRSVTPKGRFRAALPEDVKLLARWRDEFMCELLPDVPVGDSERIMLASVRSSDVFVWEDGEVVSLAMRNLATPNGQRIGPVYTPPRLRGRGYATACVASLTRLILNQGYAFACLYVDRTNARSVGIYERIGFRPVSDFDDVLLDNLT